MGEEEAAELGVWGFLRGWRSSTSTSELPMHTHTHTHTRTHKDIWREGGRAAWMNGKSICNFCLTLQMSRWRRRRRQLEDKETRDGHGLRHGGGGTQALAAHAPAAHGHRAAAAHLLERHVIERALAWRELEAVSMPLASIYLQLA